MQATEAGGCCCHCEDVEIRGILEVEMLTKFEDELYEADWKLC
jgi:hypothetical protein